MSFPVATLGVSQSRLFENLWAKTHKQEGKLVFSLHKMGTDDDWSGSRMALMSMWFNVLADSLMKSRAYFIIAVGIAFAYVTKG